ncbi:MAG: hypothetical protein AAGA56_01110 [Myxococcota bacterium]
MATSVLVALAMVGCSDDDGSDADEGNDFVIDVQARSVDDVVFSWDGGGVGSISVTPCEMQRVGETCTTARPCSTGVVLSSIDISPSIDNRIESPWTYGDEPNGDPPGFAQDLESGATYSVLIYRYGPCSEDSDPNCLLTRVASSCAIFSIP